MDHLIRATAANGQIRAFAVTSKELTEEARKLHNLSPVMTAAFGRLMAGGLMMGAMLKGEDDLLTMRIRGDGPGKGALITADAKGTVKGYVDNNNVDLPPKSNGHFDVGGAYGNGTLTVIKDMGLKEPYSGTVNLVTGEVAEDITYYLATSEQVPSSVGLGVLVDTDLTVRQAGGFIVQLMPFAEESTVSALEDKLGKIMSVTEMLDLNMGPEGMLKELLGDLDVIFTDDIPVRYHCGCSKERFKKGIISIGRKDIEELIAEGEPVETVCHFCNSKYVFELSELKELLEEI